MRSKINSSTASLKDNFNETIAEFPCFTKIPFLNFIVSLLIFSQHGCSGSRMQKGSIPDVQGTEDNIRSDSLNDKMKSPLIEAKFADLQKCVRVVIQT